ncbi:MAG: glutathione S-transferase N-terminal domain-containing protein [Candidatus Symbiobacter sp.]|nr:glutathione S-transferase N-terminal domain-containing protein [Candidatus Symbiobacter sp.]
MQLFHSTTSPFARKIMVLAIESGLDQKIELLGGATSPVKRNEMLAAKNPLGKLPALVLEDGRVLFDSSVIMQYLDTLHNGAKFYPETAAERFQVLRDESLADGMMDALVLCRYETFLRPAEKRWDEWVAGQMAKVHAGLAVLDAEFARRKPFNRNGNDAGLTTIAAMLGYLDFRQPELDWRRTCPILAAWEQAFRHRPAIQATLPRD